MSLYYGYHKDDGNKNEEYITKKGGEITGKLILNKAIIKNKPANDNDITNMSFIYDLLWETIVLNEIKNSLAYYKIDKALSPEVTYNGSNGKISYIFDQTFNENHAKQNGGLKPILCNVANGVNNRYYMEFTARSVLFSDINLSLSSNPTKIINFFMVYRLKGYDGSSYWLRNCFFRQGDWFVAFSETKDLIVANGPGTFF